MSFGDKIMDYKADIMADLSELIAIESISTDKVNCQKALEWILKKGESFGLKTKNIVNTAGHVELGEGGKLCGVLSHLDVVPPGNNWDSLPFELSVGDGYMYGRGIADDKGAALINLYCLKALKDNNVSGKNTIRAIYGTQEEIGMDDMKTYFEYEKLPDLSFTPDSQYGICKCEKGILQVELYASDHDGATLAQFHSGRARNAVPDTAYALLNCTESEDHQLSRLAAGKKGDYDFYYTTDGLMVVSHGKASHGSTPNLGINAATNLICLLASNFTLASLGSIADFINSYIKDDVYGTLLGLKSRDKDSGPLTVNVGTIHIDQGYATCTLDIRYPVTKDGDMIYDKLSMLAERENLHIKKLAHIKPLRVSPESDIIKLLSDSYEEIMGEKPDIYSSGGGTYAKVLGGNGVAFGPIFPGEDSNMHEANEKLSVDLFFTHAKICLEAMYRMYTKD